ncbi:MAG: Na+/H+ antiporter subunit E [Wolbachia endosymbiont of Armadillidium vulgare]|uniref:Na+/H+ antiporter subunit E n=1 Tax=Wolbachia endosymbiont of Armadillidium arcangelii TaxID=3158571 RepID=A0AAU7Q3J7_9RICK
MKVRQNIKFFSLSFVILFSLWIILSGYFEPFFIFCGVCSSAFTLLVFRRLVNAESTLNQILNGRGRLSFYQFVSYVPWLMYQIILSSIYVTKKVLRFKSTVEPIVIVRRCTGHNDKTIALFANSITITPGTLTINVEKKQKTYLSTICLIDKDLESGIFEIESKVLKMLHLVK